MEHTYWWHLSRVERACRIIQYYCPPPKELRAVDIGCGTGGFLHLIDKKLGFGTRLGVDRSSTAINLALRLDTRYHVADDDYLPSKDTNLVFLMDVLEHVEDDKIFLQNLVRSLPKGARVLISVPAHRFLFSEWDHRLGHHRRYSKNQLRALLNQSGGVIRHLSHGFACILPIAIFQRILARPGHDIRETEFPVISPWVNRVLLSIGRGEARASKWLPIPFGLSLFCLIEK